MLDTTNVRSLTHKHILLPCTLPTLLIRHCLFYNTVTLYILFTLLNNLFTLFTYTVYLHYCTHIYTIYLNNAFPFNQPWGALNYKIYTGGTVYIYMGALLNVMQWKYFKKTSYLHIIILIYTTKCS